MKIKINYIFWKQGPLLSRLLVCKRLLDNFPRHTWTRNMTSMYQ
jgi:hypothetical protein